MEDLTGAQEADASIVLLPAVGMAQFPPTLTSLSQLTELILYGNSLTELPKQICFLKNLSKLDVDHNKLTALPKQLGQLSELKKLSACSNHITVLDGLMLRKLVALETLYLSNNRLTVLPFEHMHPLVNLYEVKVRGNPFVDAPEYDPYQMPDINHHNGEEACANARHAVSQSFLQQPWSFRTHARHSKSFKWCVFVIMLAENRMQADGGDDFPRLPPEMWLDGVLPFFCGSDFNFETLSNAMQTLFVLDT